MYDISELKVGDIMVCGNASHRQLFYIHNIDLMNNTITSSGIYESMYRSYFKNLRYGISIVKQMMMKFYYFTI